MLVALFGAPRNYWVLIFFGRTFWCTQKLLGARKMAILCKNEKVHFYAFQKKVGGANCDPPTFYANQKKVGGSGKKWVGRKRKFPPSQLPPPHLPIRPPSVDFLCGSVGGEGGRGWVGNPRLRESETPRIRESESPRIRDSENPRLRDSENQSFRESEIPRSKIPGIRGSENMRSRESEIM